MRETVTPATPKIFGIPVSLESALKFAALIFSLGMLFSKISSMEERLTEKINSKSVIVEIKMDAFNWRLLQVEKRIDQQDQNQARDRAAAARAARPPQIEP